MPTSKNEYQINFYISNKGYFCICQEDSLSEESETLVLTPNQVKLIQSYLDDEETKAQIFKNWGDGLEGDHDNG
jgi:hypothetical protein